MIIDWNHYNDISCICLNIIIISYHNHNHYNHISDEKVGRFFDQVFRVPGTAAWQDAFAKSQGYPGALMATHPLKAGKNLDDVRRPKKMSSSLGFKNEHPQETSGNHVFVPIKSGCPVNCFSFKLIHI